MTPELIARAKNRLTGLASHDKTPKSLAEDLVVLLALVNDPERFIRAAIEEERERCCRRVCPACAAGNALMLRGKVWWHTYPERTHADYAQPCAATAIREQP